MTADEAAVQTLADSALPMEPRVSCRRCFCEIGFGPNPERAIARTEAGELDRGFRTHPPRDGEPPLDFDPDCPCDCHDVWRFVFRRGVPT